MLDIQLLRDHRNIGVPALERKCGGARRDVERAAVLAPGSSEALNGLARCLLFEGRIEEAIERAERARDRLDEGDNYVQAGPVYLTLVWCRREQRRYREALRLVEEGLARCDDSFLAAHNVGKGMMNLVDADQSAALYAAIGSPREISGGSAANTAVGRCASS